MGIVCINTVYVRVRINMYVAEPVMVEEVVRFVMANIRVVRVQRIMYGAVRLVYVIVHLNIPVAVPDIIQVVGHLVEENTRVATVLRITVGMAVPVRMFIVMFVQADIQPRVRG